MRTLFLGTLFTALLVLVLTDDQINDNSVINRINSLRAGWRAGVNERFDNMTLVQASKLLGLVEEPIPASPVARNAELLAAALNLPDEFDSRKKWPNCNMPIRNQQNCGGCWAFAASSTFSTRQCIQSNGGLKVDVSPQNAISCDSNSGGCNGGTLSAAWRFYASNGAVSDADYPFTSANGNSGTCISKPNARRYYASSFKYLRSVAAMQQEIYDNGPIQVGFDVYNDFYNYKSGVYRHVTGGKVGGHSVYLVGWGSDGYGTPYWIAINSWSQYWGMSGAFYILRGNNECNIETGYLPIAGTVVVNPSYTTTTSAPTTTRAPTSATTTKAPATTAPTRNCWTCPAGYIHWFNVPGTPEPSDKCACIVDTSSSTRDCWTCPAGYVHWFNVPGMAQPNDKCACVPNPAPSTSQPTPATTTAPARNCWTCPAGYVHWYDIAGMAEPSDKCACVPNPAPSTAQPAPSTSAPARNCWTCPAGYVHWYDIPGTPEPNDKCACIQDPRSYNCWTCPPGYIHWFEVPGMAQPTDRCACVVKQSRRLYGVHNRVMRGY